MLEIMQFWALALGLVVLFLAVLFLLLCVVAVVKEIWMKEKDHGKSDR